MNDRLLKDKLEIHHVGMVVDHTVKKEQILFTLDAIASSNDCRLGETHVKFIPEFDCYCVLIGSFEIIIPQKESKLMGWCTESVTPMHHIAVKVEDIDECSRKLSELGIPLIREEAVDGVANTRVNFVHPQYCGVMLELVEEL